MSEDLTNNNELSISEEKAKELLKGKEAIINAYESSQVKEPAPTDIIDNAIKEKEQRGLGKANSYYEKQERVEQSKTLANTLGMKMIDIKSLPSGGKFYVEGTEIGIRSARIDEIRHFSTIEETDPLDIHDKLNHIIERCTTIKIPGNPRASFKDILDMDKFYLVFAVRELTFSDGKNKLEMSIHCDNCNHTDSVTIVKNVFKLFTLDERLDKCYNYEEKCFTFNTKDGDSFNLYIPTVGVTTFIGDYIKRRSMAGKDLDVSYLKIAPFIFPDWRPLQDVMFNDTNFETMNWDIPKLSVIMGIVDILAKSIEPNIHHTCSSCGSEVTTEISFQENGGLKSLFIYTDVFAQLV